MTSIDFIGHVIPSGKKRIINFPAGKFEELDKLLQELHIDQMKDLYFKVKLEPIILNPKKEN